MTEERLHTLTRYNAKLRSITNKSRMTTDVRLRAPTNFAHPSVCAPGRLRTRASAHPGVCAPGRLRTRASAHPSHFPETTSGAPEHSTPRKLACALPFYVDNPDANACKVVGEVFVCAPERLRTRERTCSAEQHARHTCTPNTARCDHFGRTRALYPAQTGMCVAFLCRQPRRHIYGTVCHEPGRVFTYKADEDRLKSSLVNFLI